MRTITFIVHAPQDDFTGKPGFYFVERFQAPNPNLATLKCWREYPLRKGYEIVDYAEIESVPSRVLGAKFATKALAQLAIAAL